MAQKITNLTRSRRVQSIYKYNKNMCLFYTTSCICTRNLWKQKILYPNWDIHTHTHTQKKILSNLTLDHQLF